MAVPPTVRQAIADAQAAMLQHSQHIVLPFYRQAIYHAFGPRDAPVSCCARAMLSTLTARYVLPVWQDERPDDPWPERLVAMAEGVLSGQVDATHVDAVLQEAWEWLTHMSPEWWGNPHASNAGGAAVFAVNEVQNEGFLWDVDIGVNDPDDEFFELGIGDTAMFAAAAFAGPPWDRGLDPGRAHAFWTWWLEEAIPDAWNLAAST